MSFLSPSTSLGRALRQSLARWATLPRRHVSDGGENWRELAGKRIAILKWDGIGDFVLATTFLHRVYTELSSARVTLFCQAHVASLAAHQYARWNIQSVPPRIKPMKRIYTQLGLRREFATLEPFDVLLDLRSMRDMSDSVLASWIPARVKVTLRNQYEAPGVVYEREDTIYDHLEPGPTETTPEDCLDIWNYRHWWSKCQPTESSREAVDSVPILRVTDEDRMALQRKLERFSWPHHDRPFLLICPGSLEPIKEYPPTDLAEAIRLVHQRNPMPVVLAGSSQDTRTTSPLRQALQGITPVTDLTGKLSLVEHVGLVSMANAVLAMDSGTAHIAGALGRPAVIILGGGHPGLFAPWGASEQFRWLQNKLPCYGCYWVCVFDKPICIRDIRPDFIAQNLLEIMTVQVRGR